jgi:hypothetical protein
MPADPCQICDVTPDHASLFDDSLSPCPMCRATCWPKGAVRSIASRFYDDLKQALHFGPDSPERDLCLQRLALTLERSNLKSEATIRDRTDGLERGLSAFR